MPGGAPVTTPRGRIEELNREIRAAKGGSSEEARLLLERARICEQVMVENTIEKLFRGAVEARMARLIVNEVTEHLLRGLVARPFDRDQAVVEAGEHLEKALEALERSKYGGI